MASPAHHSSTPWRRRYWRRRQSHDVLRNRTPSPRLGPRNVRAGTTFQHAHDWRPARPQPTTHGSGARRMRAGTLSLDFQNTHPSVIIRYPFRALLHANLFPRARVAAPRLGTQVTDLLRVWNLDCFRRVPEIGISTTPEASLPDRLQSVPSTLFTSRPSERPSAALARASFRLSQLSFSRSPRAKKGAIARRAVPGLLSVPGPICWSHWAML